MTIFADEPRVAKLPISSVPDEQNTHGAEAYEYPASPPHHSLSLLFPNYKVMNELSGRQTGLITFDRVKEQMANSGRRVRWRVFRWVLADILGGAMHRHPVNTVTHESVPSGITRRSRLNGRSRWRMVK